MLSNKRKKVSHSTHKTAFGYPRRKSLLKRKMEEKNEHEEKSGYEPLNTRGAEDCCSDVANSMRRGRFPRRLSYQYAIQGPSIKTSHNF